MNVRDEIVELLTGKGCTIEEKVGIFYVTTPDGVVWDMTVPMSQRPPAKLNADGACATCAGHGVVVTCHLEDPEGHGGLKPCPSCRDDRWQKAWDEYWSTRQYPSRDRVVPEKQ